MKRVKVLLIALLLVIPVYVFATGTSTYSEGLIEAEGYIKKGSYKKFW